LASIAIVAPPESAGLRLDHFLHTALPEYSRARLQDWIRAGRVLVDARAGKASQSLRGGEHIDVTPAPLVPLKAVASRAVRGCPD